MTMEDRGLTTAERSTVPEERRTGLRGPVSHALPLFDIVFVAVMLVLLGAFTIGFAVDPTGAQSHVFFLQTKDFFADYFNVCEMSAGLNPYWYGLDDPTPWEHGYPPLCYLIFYVLSGFADYGSLDAFSAGYTTMGMASAVLFMSGLVVLFALLLRQGYRRQGVLGMLMPVALLGSSIVMHSIERGNIIIADRVFGGNAPFGSEVGVVDLDTALIAVGGVKEFIHKFLHILFVNPCAANSHLNFACI
mgnify:CR=1 FL=1